MNEKSKASRILSELVNYFLNNNINKVDINVDYGTSILTINLKGKSEKEPDGLNKLNEIFKASRQIELEEYYWKLLGANNFKQELYLLGSLVDDGEVEYKNGELKLKIVRDLTK